MDNEFVVLAIVFLFVGATGVLLFTGPKTPAGDSCYCAIPSPEAGAMQGTSGVLLIFGVLFLPVGLLKGGLPSFGRKAPLVPYGRTFTPVPFTSPRLFGAGVLILFLSIFVIVPALFVFFNAPLAILGAVIAAFGAYLLYAGSKLRP